MREGSILGWFAVNALSAALLFLVLLFFDPLWMLAKDGHGAALLMTGLAVLAVLLGVSSFRTKPGRVGAIGGGVLLILIVLGWLLFVGEPFPRPNPHPGAPSLLLPTGAG